MNAPQLSSYMPVPLEARATVPHPRTPIYSRSHRSSPNFIFLPHCLTPLPSSNRHSREPQATLAGEAVSLFADLHHCIFQMQCHSLTHISVAGYLPKPPPLLCLHLHQTMNIFFSKLLPQSLLYLNPNLQQVFSGNPPAKPEKKKVGQQNR